jgi:cholesterol transport system auxiliary component
MRMRHLQTFQRILNTGLWGLLALFLGGCGASLLQQPDSAVTHTYLLEWQPPGSPAQANPEGPSLLVMPVMATPGFATADMAYMRTPYELEYFARHRWVDVPARMLDPLLVGAATQTGLFSSVVESGSRTGADLRLDSTLLHLQQVCRLNPSEQQLAMRVQLVDLEHARVVAARTLSVSEPLQERTPYAGVLAANRAVARLLGELQEFLAGAVRDVPR